MAQKLKKIGDKLRGKLRVLSVLCMTTMLCLQPALAASTTTTCKLRKLLVGNALTVYPYSLVKSTNVRRGVKSHSVACLSKHG